MTRRRVTTLVCVLASLLGGLGLAGFYARVLAPERRATATGAAPATDRSALDGPLAPAVVAVELTRLLALGSRYVGDPGNVAAGEEVRRVFESAGLEVSEQRFRTLVPRTSRRELRRDDGGTGPDTLLPGVEVYPLMPNHLQPVVTQPGGLHGRLVLLDRKTLATAHDLGDAIGVLDAGPGGVDPAYGFHWARYARLGVKALIVAHRGGLEAIDWADVAQRKGGLVSSVPVSFVRLAATAGIFDHLGERVRLDVRVDFREEPSRTLFGVLRAPHPAGEAIAVVAPHDAAAVLPDLAPGALPAIQSAWLLALARGLAASRSTLTRDIVFVSSGSSAMGEEGLNQLLRVLRFNTFENHGNRLTEALAGSSDDGRGGGANAGGATLEARLAPLGTRESEQRERAGFVRAALERFAEPDFFAKDAATAHGLAGLSPAARRFFLEQVTHVVGSVVLERQEAVLAARLAFERGGESTSSPAFEAYRAARQRLDAANALAGTAPEHLFAGVPSVARDVGVRERSRARFMELLAHHAARLSELASDRQVAQLFSRYERVDFIKPSFVPSTTPDGAEVLSLYAHSSQGTQSVELLLLDAARRLGGSSPDFRIEKMATNQVDLVENNCQPWPLAHYFMLYGDGYQGLGLVHFERQAAYREWASPVVKPFMRDLSSLAASFRASGELVLGLGRGAGRLNATPGWPWQRRTYGGRVLVAGVGRTLVPSFALSHAVVGARSSDGEEQYSELGYWRQPFYATDPYGRFDLPEQTADFPVWWRTYGRGYAYTPVAAGYGPDGLIAFMKDEGEATQGLFKSVDVPMGNEAAIANTTLVTFRAAPVSVLDLVNPQDFKDYSGVSLITRDGLTPFASSCEFTGLGFTTTFLPPEQYAKVLLQAGVPGNDRARETRAFLLGPRDPRAGPGHASGGTGYLVADHPFLLDVPVHAGESMARVNGARLEQQNRYGMADERTNRHQKHTLELLEQAHDRTLPIVTRHQRARDAVSYAGLDYPVLERSLTHAVLGILFYLGLLAPFAFCAEKLLFCCADARRQLAAQGVIFVSAFALLRLLHPAFALVRSPLMILLGFVIVLVTAGVTVLFAGKARDSIQALGTGRGRAAGADSNVLGVVVAALLVGLNNMHRRKVRTGLTCATLTLLTFVMICFTGTQGEIVSQTLTLGAADYQGLLVKHDDFVPLSKSEVFALTSKFGDRYPVVERRFYTGVQDWNERKRVNPALSAAFDAPGGRRSASFGSILKLEPREPLAGGLRLLTRRGWFLPEHALADGGPCPVLVPERLAERLGIAREAVDTTTVLLGINGKQFRVWGIFEASSLDALRDLDGRDLLPFDIERVATASETSVGTATVTTAKSTDPRIPAERVLITPVRDSGFFVANAKELTGSAAVVMGDVPYASARAEIEGHLERTAQPAYFGLDGVAFRGLSARQATLAGLLELLVPLVLAALTVLNTMRGSVYERRGEIAVYNAVGVAPRYVAAMFLAESLVYVVIGSVLGYFLSQGLGRALTAHGLTGGLPMTFTSLGTIGVTLALGAAVLLSTWFPARDAMRIAAPADESGWSLPEPVGDELAFDLPFSFKPRARLAVLAFFQHWFAAHGEGSAGAFFAGPAELRLDAAADTPDAELVPELSLMIWLKPFDLAVSQRLRLTLPIDRETGEFAARLTLSLRSGTREAWLRLNRTFVAQLRRHFLSWREVDASEEQALFSEARALLESRHPELAGPSTTARVPA